MKGVYVFTQICRFFPREEFKWFIRKYEGDKSVKTFKCWNQLLALIFGQLAGCESLRVLVSSFESKLYHHGIGKNISMSNFAYANQVRNPKKFEDLANLMIKMARNKVVSEKYENTVRIQIYYAIIAYCHVAILERKIQLNMDIYSVLQFLEKSAIDKTTLRELFENSRMSEEDTQDDCLQLTIQL